MQFVNRLMGLSLIAGCLFVLGDPLGIDIRSWLTDPQGIYFGGNDMRLSPMALLKIGELSWTERGTSR